MPPSLYYLVMTPQSDQNSSLHSILRKLCSKLLFKGFIVSNYVSLFFFLMSFNQLTPRSSSISSNVPIFSYLFRSTFSVPSLVTLIQHIKYIKKKKISHLLYLPKVFQIQPLLHHSASLILSPPTFQLLNHFN